MKVLIIAGPYEADRLRRAAVSAGFETVAVEPGESLSGWITATRPDLIVMAPKIVNPDPAVALAKVRTVPRGRVPIFLVGDAADEARFKGLADGFFVRPVASADLMAEARLLLGTSIVGGAGGAETADAGDADAAGAAKAMGGEEGVPLRAGADPGSDGFQDRGSGPTPKSGSHATPKSGPHRAPGSGPHEPPKSGPQLLKSPPSLKPLVAEGDLAAGRSTSSTSSPSSSGSGPHVGPDLMSLDESIEATLEAELREAIRGVGPRDRTGTPVGRPQHGAAKVGASAPSGNAGAPDAAAAGANPALEELRDESSQKTLEVPREVVARMASADSHAAGHNGTSGARGPLVLAPAQQGDLSEEDLPLLLGRIYGEQLTGWLTLKRDVVEKAIVFERGAPILAGSNLAEDRLGEMLVRQGRLSVEHQSRSVATSLSTGRRLGTVLVDAGYIKAGDLAPLVRRHFEEIIYSLFAWETGTWALTPDRPEKEETVLLTQHPVALIVEGIRRKYSAARLRARLGGGQAVPRVIRESGLSALLEQMALTDQERALVAWFDGVRTMDEIAARSGADDATLYGVARALLVLRRVELVATPADTGPADASDAAATLMPDGGPARERERAAERERERDREIDRARILARHALVREGDYFQILGVSSAASPHEIRRAHQMLVRELSAPGVAPDLQADLAIEIEAIRAVLDEGARVLGDARLRQRYQTHLPAAAERSPA